MRATRVVVNTSHLRNNLVHLQNLIKTPICLVVKANAYGHGIVKVAEIGIECGVKYLAVATMKEASMLREAGIQHRILLLSNHIKEEVESVCNLDIEPVINHIEHLPLYEKYTKDKILNFHIKIETGMNRSGIPLGKMDYYISEIAKYKNIKLVGICTHFAASEDEKEKDFTLQQIAIFDDVIKKHSLQHLLKHCANTEGAIRFSNARYDMVRIGLSAYGYLGSGDKSHPLKPALNLMSKIVHTKRIKAGDSVSYNKTWIAEKDTNIALLPIGYADGLHRSLSNKIEVKINGKYYKQIGLISMDQCVIDLGDDEIELETDVMIFGDDERLNQKTLYVNHYEFIASISERVPRIYIE